MAAVEFCRADTATETWRRGRLAFESTCARCHGADGNQGDYPHIKRLNGIGDRLSEGEIRERLRIIGLPDGSFTVRGTVFQSRDLDALLKYVRSL